MLESKNEYHANASQHSVRKFLDSGFLAGMMLRDILKHCPNFVDFFDVLHYIYSPILILLYGMSHSAFPFSNALGIPLGKGEFLRGL